MNQSWLSGETEMARRIREHEWAGSSLGAIEKWSPRLRIHVETMLASAQAVAIMGGPDRVMLYNDACAAVLVARHPRALGRSARETFEETAPVLTQRFDRAFSGETVVIKSQPLQLDGAKAASTNDIFDICLTPLHEDDGSTAYVHMVLLAQQLGVEAEAALKESEQRQTFLLKLSDALRPLADPVEIQRAAMRILGQHLKASRVAYSQITDHEYIIETDYVDGVPSMAGRYPIDAFGPKKVSAYQEGVTRIVPDAEADSFNDAAAVANFAALGVRAGIGVPLFKNGRLVATLVVHQREPRRWTSQDVALAEETAERTWAALEQARAEAALRASEQKYRSLFENLGQGYAECELIRDADGHVTDFRYIMLNPAFERLTGLKIAGMTGRTAREAVPDIADTHFQMHERIADAGVPSRHEYRIDALDRWYETYIYPSENDRFFALYEDITERKRADAALRESEARLTAAFESVPVGIAVIDLSGRVQIANAEYLRFLPRGLIPSRDPKLAAQWRAWDAEGRLLEPNDFPSARTLRGETVVPGQEMLFTNDEGREIWTNVATAPVRDEGGYVTGAFSIISDIDIAKRSAAALRDSEERLREFGNASQDILWIRDATTLQWQYLTPAFETIYGISRDQALSGDDYRNWQDLIVPEDRERAVASIERVLGGERVMFEYRIRRPVDGQIRWLRNTDFPILDAQGGVRLIGGVGHDMTDAKEVQERLAQEGERLKSAVEVGRIGLWDWDVRTGVVHWSDEHFRLLGYQADEIAPSYEAWVSRLHSDDRGAVEAALRAAIESGTEYIQEFRVAHADGSIHWLSGRGRFFYDESGAAIRMVGAMMDVTERREWEDRQRILVAELQHRTRNLMGVVRAIADKTAHASPDIDDFKTRFKARLDALARVQSLLSRLNEHDRVTFDQLVRAELTALDGAAERVTLRGPLGIRLRSSTVQTLAMALHELATNAVKYGALGQPDGALAVTWSISSPGEDGKPWLHIDWRESSVIMPDDSGVPTGTGQGRELIERALPYQLRARTTYVLGPDGVRCTISIPVSAATGDEGERDG